MARIPVGLMALVVLIPVVGCIERTVSINTEPEGATVLLNDQEVGKSPVKVPFTWYGDYDIIIRKPGYETIRTNHKLTAPWYQWPVIDIFAECLVPVTIHDDRTIDTFVLQARKPAVKQDLLEAADATRQEARASGS
jgi:hypothetical protein